ERVLANPLYHNITSRFVNSHDYLAMEQLHHLDAAGEFDLVVVDTPPSRNALDLIDAPQRMREFFASSLLRWLTVPASSRVVALATKPFTQIADRILGRRFLQDVTDFFVLLRTMEDGFVRRAAEVEALIAADTSTFVIVSTCEPAPVREAGFLATELRARNLPLGGLVLNRVMPDDIGSEIAAAAATTLLAGADDESVVTSLADGLDQPADGVRHVLATVGRRFGEVREQAATERVRRSELAAAVAGAVVATAPAVGGDVHDLVGLERLAAHLGGHVASDGSP
ncbi:MAG: ArsA family ATPase, partial [Ilumatobacteraceae bacterium]